MKFAFLLIAVSVGAATFPDSEELRYNVNWPSGLSLGEAHLSGHRVKSEAGERWESALSLEAAVPGFQVLDHYRSLASSPQLCSIELEKDLVHGRRKGREKTEFDQQHNTAVRQTVGGGKSDLSTGACARDGLAFLQWVRRELSQGRLPPSQTVYFGAPYRVRFEYTGVQALRIGDSRTDADRLLASIKGPQSEITIEMFFARDPGRTPLLVRVPLALGTFSMELVR